MRRSRSLAGVAATVASALVLSLLPGTSAMGAGHQSATRVAEAVLLPSAVTASQWRPGNIISDAVFYAPNAMSAAQVQAFLNSQGSNCVAGEQPCLKDYRMTTPTRAAEAGLCGTYMGATDETAAQIVAKVGQACGISPQVLLVLLQKETSLVTKTRPTTSNYNRATGFGCPDTGPNGTANCNVQYYGFFNQLYRAARQYLVYRNNPTRYGYQAGRLNSILFHPNTACGTQQVFIENQATAGLYIYTPYVPNAAALANFAGTGDSCSSYGNRNFFRLFSEWFGDPRGIGLLVKAPGAPAIYLLDSGAKRHITDPALFSELQAKLGAVSEVSASVLDSYPTAPDMQRVVRNRSTGAIFFLSPAGLSWFSACGAVEAWTNRPCGLASIDVDAVTLGKLSRGPDIGAVASNALPAVLSMAHARDIGWMPWAGPEQLVGTTGQSRPLEAVSLNYIGSPGSVVECRAHLAGTGWVAWVGQSGTCGTTGQRRQLEAVQLRLQGPDAATKTVWYRAHVSKQGWLPWASSGETAGTTGLGLPVEALEVAVLPVGSPPPGTASPIEYRAHAATLGWMASVRDGATAGTTGESRRLEAIAVGFPVVQSWPGSVECSAHSASIGWMDWVPAGATCGTTGRALQLEAVRLRLTGTVAAQMDIWYRVHSANIGWLGWARNGEGAGTQGFGTRAEAIEIRYLPKGSSAPGPTTDPLRVR